MSALLRLKRPRGGATPDQFALPGPGDDSREIKVGRNGEACNVFLYVDEHPSFLSRIHATFRFVDAVDEVEVERSMGYSEEDVLEVKREEPKKKKSSSSSKSGAQSASGGSASPVSVTDSESSEEEHVSSRRGEEGGWWEVVDCRSVNGVFVNGERLEPAEGRRLAPGDRIFFGNPQHSFFLEYEFVITPRRKDSGKGVRRAAAGAGAGAVSAAAPPAAQPPAPPAAPARLRHPLEEEFDDEGFSGAGAGDGHGGDGGCATGRDEEDLERVPFQEDSSELCSRKRSHSAVSAGEVDVGRTVEVASALQTRRRRPREYESQSAASAARSGRQQEATTACSSSSSSSCPSSSLSVAGGGASPRKRSKSASCKSLLMRTMGGDLWPHLAEFLELTEIFKARGVCAAFRDNNQRYLSQVTSIRWSHKWEQAEVGNLLRLCSNVVSIDASGCYNITDTQVELIAKYAGRIENLDLSGCSRISTKAVKELSTHCRSIRSIRLRACKRIASSEAANFLCQLARRCTELEHLDLRCCNMEDESLIRLSRHCGNLLSLDIGSTGFANVSDAVLVALGQNCTKLERLGVMCCRLITDAGVAAVARGCGRTLKHLTLHCCFEVTNNALASLARHCAQLEVLNVHRCLKISDEGIEKLTQGCGATLRSLDVSACKITDTAILAIASNCAGLRVLDLRSCELITSDSICKVAKQCPQLEQIDLSCCKKLDDRVIQALTNCSKKLVQVEFGKGFNVSKQAHDALIKALGNKAAVYF
jgi:pSer/pThr/pTyr-binding forkhead associated (FHA) protein